MKKADDSPYTPGTWTNQSVTVDFACTRRALRGRESDARPGHAHRQRRKSERGPTCTDNAGNCDAASQANIDIDKVDPAASVLSVKKADDSAYTPGTWTNQSVTVDFACTDGLSGVASLTPDPVTLTGSGEDQSASTTCTDNAGNTDGCEPGQHRHRQGRTRPSRSPGSLPAPLHPRVGPAAGCSTSDALSGVKTNAALLPLTGPGTTNPNGVGSFTASCSGAEDNAANAGSASVTYNVGYGGFARFLQPINNTGHDLGSNPDVSTFKAGSTVPVKSRSNCPTARLCSRRRRHG